MTREEAKKEIIDMANALQLIPNTPKGKAVSMALKALEQEPCEDCIRRSDVGLTDFEIVMCDGDYKEGLKMLLDKIEKAPPVTPQPKTGHWIMTGDYLITASGNVDYVKCSCCREYSLEEGDYCSNCGARMIDPQESEE